MATAFASTSDVGTMDDKGYDILGEEPNTEKAWGLVRDVVGNRLLGSEFVPVPFIESAAYYNQLFVFTKKPSLWSAIRIRPPTYKVIGNLDYLVNRNVSSWDPQFDFTPWDVADGQNRILEYNLRVQSNQQGVHKSIELTVLQAHVRCVQQPPTPGNVTIYRNLLEDLDGVNTLYVITNVVLVSRVTLLVRIDNQSLNFNCDRDIPIGFRYRKYRLRNDGTFAAELSTSQKIHKDDAIWIKPLPQPIPPVPVWDCMNRRCDVAVKMNVRSNLTIPPLKLSPVRILSSQEAANASVVLRDNDFNEIPSVSQRDATNE